MCLGYNISFAPKTHWDKGAVEVNKINSHCERNSPPKFYDTRRFYADARYQSAQKRPTTATKWRSVEHVNLG